MHRAFGLSHLNRIIQTNLTISHLYPTNKYSDLNCKITFKRPDITKHHLCTKHRRQVSGQCLTWRDGKSVSSTGHHAAGNAIARDTFTCVTVSRATSKSASSGRPFSTAVTAGIRQNPPRTAPRAAGIQHHPGRQRRQRVSG